MMISQEQQKAIGEECRQAALLYRERGWSPLALCPPNHIGVGKVHGRKCLSPGKSPLIKWYEHQERIATADEIVEWWKRNCLSNVGIALGPVSGFIRVDAEGETGNRLLEEVSGGDLPETLEFTSGQPWAQRTLTAPRFYGILNYEMSLSHFSQQNPLAGSVTAAMCRISNVC